MNIDLIIGIFLLFLSVATFVVSFLIAVRQYTGPKNTLSIPTNIIQMFLQLLDDILKAPPALAFLVTGVLIGAIAIWILTIKPI